MPTAMDVTQEPDGGPRSVQEHGNLLVLVLLAFVVGHPLIVVFVTLVHRLSS